MSLRTGTASGEGTPIAWIDQGPLDAPVVLLVAGADATAERWSPTLVDALLAGGRRVVRYDHRDTGRSGRVPASRPYTLAELTADALAVLDAAGVARAHVLGHSMGGRIAQDLALGHRSRVTGLTLVATSPGPVEGLSAPAEDYEAALLELMWAPPPSTPDERVRRHVALAELVAGPGHPGSHAERVACARREVDRGWEPETGHGPAVGAAPAAPAGRLGSIAVAVTVVHGDADPVYGPDHARVLSEAIPDARLVVVPGWGHDLPTSVEEVLVEAVPAPEVRGRQAPVDRAGDRARRAQRF